METKAIVNNKDTAPSYGLNWKSNKETLNDTYTRTLDASEITNDSVKAQVGETPVTNAFDELDIYKDILPYTDEFGNEFMLIPKFYISKKKEVTDTEISWDYAVSKHKLDDSYYLPSNFVDEGIDNNKHIELPYVLVGKYEAGSNGKTGEEEMLVSKTSVIPRVDININEARDMATRYNDIEGINGYQQYDIHVHDMLTMLFAIEFKTMNSQSIMRGYSDAERDANIMVTGNSDFISSSSGNLLNNGFNSFNYRGIENLWGNIWAFTDGLNIDQRNSNNSIYFLRNSRYYSSDNITEYYKILEDYKKLNEYGYIIENGFDKEVPFVNLPKRTSDSIEKGVSDYFYQNTDSELKIVAYGGSWHDWNNTGLSSSLTSWNSLTIANDVGS